MSHSHSPSLSSSSAPILWVCFQRGVSFGHGRAEMEGRLEDRSRRQRGPTNLVGHQMLEYQQCSGYLLISRRGTWECRHRGFHTMRNRPLRRRRHGQARGAIEASALRVHNLSVQSQRVTVSRNLGIGNSRLSTLLVHAQ